MRGYLVLSGKFWEIETNGRSYTVEYGKIGNKGTVKGKHFNDTKSCKNEANKQIELKKKEGYKLKEFHDNSDDEMDLDNNNNNKRKRKRDQLSDNDSDIDIPAAKKQKKGNNNDTNDDDDKIYDIIKEILTDEGKLCLENEDNKDDEIEYKMLKKGYILKKDNKPITKKFNSKNDAFNACVKAIYNKLDDGYFIKQELDVDAEISCVDVSSCDEDVDIELDNENIFNEMNISISGSFTKPQKIIKQIIADNGGILKNTVTNNTNYLIVNDNEDDFSSSKCVSAIVKGITIVGESWLHDSVKKGKLMNIKKYVKGDQIISDDDEEENIPKKKKKRPKKKKSKGKSNMDSDSDDDVDMDKSNKSKSYKKMVLKGSAPVDDEFQHKDDYKVYEGKGCVWDAMLNQTNISNNNNKFYKLQILEKDTGGHYTAWFRWGRVGYTGQNSAIVGGTNIDKCINAFKKKFKDKTKNDWDDRDNFEAYPGKYTYLKMNYKGNNNNNNNDNSSDDDIWDDNNDNNVESKLDNTVQDLIQLIFDKDMMEEQMKEIGYDAKKLPLGKIDKTVIDEALELLKEIDDELIEREKAKKSKKKRRQKNLTNLSSAYYTMVPHVFGMKTPPTINTKKMLSKELKLVESLLEIEIATRLLKGENKDNIEHPIDRHYNSLKCELNTMNKKDKMYKNIVKYVKTNHGATHNSYTLDVMDIFEVNRDGEDKKFKKYCNNNNRMLLWHGSRLTNFVGILSEGLRIAPPSAPVTGYMFGKGVYFADICSKSANYCWTNANNNTGLMLLCEVALGQMNELKYADYYANNLPAGMLSTLGKGKTEPNKKTWITMDNGCIIPIGKPKIDHSFVGALLYNEMIVYNTNQIKMKYLVKLKFNYDDEW